MKFFLGNYEKAVKEKFDDMHAERVIDRIWTHDFTLWSDSEDEITNRLGWLYAPDVTAKQLSDVNVFVESLKADGIKTILLMGMGGSSLAPELFSLMFNSRDGYPELHVLDSTDPGAVLNYKNKLKPEETVYIVSTKSGGTVETLSFMKYFYTAASEKLGDEKAGDHFVAITDPESGLEKRAKELNFRKIFLADPDIGGRYSALSLFGVVPAASIGVDVKKLLASAKEEVERSKIVSDNMNSNEAALLGVIMGVMAEEGRDKLTFISSEKFKFFGAWAEQLIAESTGKNGKGIMPVDLEETVSEEYYSADRLFVYFSFKNENQFDDKVERLKSAGHPVVEIRIDDLYDLGREFFRWEFATAVTGWAIGIQPFDQPNVEQAKVIAKKMMKEYEEKGKLPELKPSIDKDGIKVYGDVNADSPVEALTKFLKQIKRNESYISLQAYVKPDEETTEALQNLRTIIQKKYKVATTVGYGPRFLHSTGQLHKGDAGTGLFIQFLGDMPEDAEIPDDARSKSSSYTFGILKNAQLMGDRQALLDNGRKVITFDLGEGIVESIDKLKSGLN